MKPLNYPSLLKSFIAELGKELAMRRTVWRVIPGTSHKFGDSKKQSRYDKMRLMEKVFKEMQPKELETIVNRINRKKAEAKKPVPKLFLVILLAIALQFFAFSLTAQKVIPLNSVDTIDHNSILEIFSLHEHLKFYHEKQMLDIKVAYKPTGGKFNFKEEFQKSGVINYAAIHLGTYKFIIQDKSSTCRCIIEMDFKKEDSKVICTLEYELHCWDAKFPNPNKPVRKL